MSHCVLARCTGYYTVAGNKGVLQYRFRYTVHRTQPLSIVAEGIPRVVLCSVRTIMPPCLVSHARVL
jgi:hypothetical protein